jgi:hypothetical protein
MKGATTRAAGLLAVALLAVLGFAAPTAAAAVTMAPAGSVAAEVWPVFLWNKHTSRCLEDSFAGGLRTLTCRDVGTQVWYETSWETIAERELRNSHTNRCLEDSFVAGLRAVACNLSSSQGWYQSEPRSDFTWALRNAHTGRCLDDSFAAGVRAVACNGSNSQRWDPV